MKNFILYGPPGSGKSTTVELLEEKGVPFSLLSMGQILREKAKTDENIRNIIAKGELVDEKYIFMLAKKELEHIDKNKLIVIDGYPRNLNQAGHLDEIFKELDLKLPVLIYIKITKEEAVKRLSSRRVCTGCKDNFQFRELIDKEKCPNCGGKLIQREDDKPVSIEKRFELFEMQFDLIKYYYEKQNRYFEVDGMQERKDRINKTLEIIKEQND